MICQNCKQETEEGKFCTNCGAELVVDHSAADHSAATVEASTEPAVESDTTETVETTAPVQAEQTVQETNEYAEKLKGIGSDFGQFFITLVKKPTEARNADQNALISSIIVMAIFSILVALERYITISNYSSDYFGSARSEERRVGK